MGLTGKTRYRAGWGGKLILQVEYAYDGSSFDDMWPRTCIDWRDAKMEDLAEIELDSKKRSL